MFLHISAVSERCCWRRVEPSPARFLFNHLGERVSCCYFTDMWCESGVLSSTALDWTELCWCSKGDGKVCVCVQSSALRQSPSILSYKCSDFPVAKLTFAEEAPPKPPRLFLMANSKESPADSPVITWANRETFLSWLGFFQGLVLLVRVLLEKLTVLQAGASSLADWSPGTRNPVNYFGMESSRKCCREGGSAGF